MLVRNAWHAVGFSPDFEIGKPVAVEVIGELVVVYRAEDGRLHALEDRCRHRFAPLSLGRCEGSNIRCMYHGLLFDPSGKCIEIPGAAKVPDIARVRRYPIKETGNWVMLWGGDPDSADESRLPGFVPMDGPDYRFATGWMDYQASCDLINANLLDFTHLGYVHTESFMGEADVWAKASSKVITTANGVHLEWWVPRTKMPDVAGFPPDFRVDQYLVYDYTIPGNLSMWINIYPAGTGDSLNFARPTTKPLSVDYTSQSVRALDSARSRYYYTWGVPAELDDAEKVAQMRLKLSTKAFEEDRRMIQAQQRVISRTPPQQRIMPNPHDKAITVFELLMKKIARESEIHAGNVQSDTFEPT